MLFLEARNVKKAFGDRQLFAMEEPLRIYRGDRIGIVGTNGAGKSTLLRLLAGDEQPDEGVLQRHGTLAFVRQWEENRGCSDGLSGGEETRRRLAEAFAAQADVLLADEPTSHLDLDGIMEVERTLAAYPGAVLLVSHDRDLLDAVCTRTLEVENGKLTVYSGSYRFYQAAKMEQQKRAWADFDNYVAKKEQLTVAIADKKQRADRATKTPRGVSDFEARKGKPYYAAKAAKMERGAKAIERRLEKLEAVEKPRELPAVRFDLQAYTPVHGKTAIRLTGLARIVGQRTLFRGLSAAIPPGAKVALLGANGAGKSTLLRMIAERAEGVQLAGGVRLGYFHQQQQNLNERDTVLENVMATSIHPETTVRTVLARLLFKREDVHKRVEMLSGGERVKTALAKLFLGDCNVLLLDEPTNYLDLPTREELEAVLADYPGTLLFATHDRRFASRLANRILSLEQDKHVWFDGSYEELKAAKRKPESPVDDDGEALLRLELERDAVLSRLSAPGKRDNVAELDTRYKELTAEIGKRKNGRNDV